VDLDESGDLLDFDKAKPIPEASTAYGMIRVSQVGKRSRPGETMLSVPEQRSIISASARENNIRIVGWRKELDVSGGRVDREVLEATLADVFAGKADGIICADVSRYARTTDGLQAVRKLNANGKTFIAVREGIGPASLSTPAGWLLFTIMIALAEFQLRLLTAGWQTARQAYIEAGIANHVPYGYRKRAKDAKENARHLERDPAQAPHVVFMFKRRMIGDSWSTIARKLDARKAPTPNGGAVWHYETVRRIVLNRAYLGESRSGEFVNHTAHEPLVTLKLFTAAGEQAKTANHNGTAAYPLTGLVRCASCGGRMNGYATKHPRADGTITIYDGYRCRRHFGWGRCESPAYVPARELERLVVREFFRRFMKELDAEQRADDRSADLAKADDAIEEARESLDLFRASPETARSVKLMGKGWYEKELAKLNDRIEAALTHYASVREAMTGIALPTDLDEAWPNLTTDEQRGFLSAGFGVVAVKPGEAAVEDRIRIWARNEPGAPEFVRGEDGLLPRTPIIF